MDERPLTVCPECAGEIDLTFAEEGDRVICSFCGSELVVLSIDPPEVDREDSTGG
jgi:lysine biosynthesis protein LysW